jgi:GT2 family glycosyltransferase
MGGVVAFRPTAPIWIADNDEVAALRVPLCLEDQPESPAIDLLKPALSRFVNKGKGQRSPRSVSVIIPTRGQEAPMGRALVLDLIDSLGLGHDPSVDVVVVADNVTPANVLTELGRYPSMNVEMYDRPFNFADKCNQGALRAEGDIIFFLNDDMVHVEGDWKEILCRWLSDADIGAVGGLLLSPDGSVQCAGHANSPVPHLFGVGRDPESDPAVMFPRECSGLSGACLAVRREDFLEVGGMCIDLPNSYNDVDLCFKLLAKGKRLLYTPEFRFLHFESASRNPTVDHAATELIHRRWGRYLKADPYPPPGT